MLNMVPLKDANRAESYFGKSDGGYYIKDDEMHREWGGKGSVMLGLTGTPKLEEFRHLLHGLDPNTGDQLTAKLIEERLPAWDFTASLPKGVTTALEGGDSRIRAAFWEVANEAMRDVETMATTRVRKGGKDEDRVTGNMVWLAVEHPDTRPLKEDGMSDWDRHIHFVVCNATFDPVEREWKAVKIRPVFDIRKYFSHAFDARMSAKLAELGYEIETKLQPDGRGGMKYHTWDIKAAPGHEQGWQSINAKNSRRHGEIDGKEAEIVASMKKRDPNAPDHLGAVARSKLPMTTRQEKREDLTLDDLRQYWASRITPQEGTAIETTITRAKLGLNPKPEKLAAQAMEYAIAHHFQRNSVVDFTTLAVTAMEKSMGGALPEDFKPEAERLGVLFEGGKVTTRAVWEQEQKIIGFARNGKGIFSPLAPGTDAGLSGLSDEQKTAVRHVWESTDQVVLIRGGAGTGKTTMMTPALAELGTPVVLLAPSADASRTTLRKEALKDANVPAAFKQADTVAAFLGNEDMQKKLRGGGIIWVDEAGLLAINDLDRLCEVASKLDARLVLQGDPKQHKGSRLGTEKIAREDAIEMGNQPLSCVRYDLNRVFSMAEISSFPPCLDTVRKAAKTPSFEGEAAKGFFAMPLPALSVQFFPFRGVTPYCWAGNAALASQYGCKESALLVILRDMERAGIIYRVAKHHGRPGRVGIILLQRSNPDLPTASRAEIPDVIRSMLDAKSDRRDRARGQTALPIGEPEPCLEVTAEASEPVADDPGFLGTMTPVFWGHDDPGFLGAEEGRMGGKKDEEKNDRSFARSIDSESPQNPQPEPRAIPPRRVCESEVDTAARDIHARIYDGISSAIAANDFEQWERKYLDVARKTLRGAITSAQLDAAVCLARRQSTKCRGQRFFGAIRDFEAGRQPRGLATPPPAPPPPKPVQAPPPPAEPEAPIDRAKLAEMFAGILKRPVATATAPTSLPEATAPTSLPLPPPSEPLGELSPGQRQFVESLPPHKREKLWRLPAPQRDRLLQPHLRRFAPIQAKDDAKRL